MPTSVYNACKIISQYFTHSEVTAFVFWRRSVWPWHTMPVLMTGWLVFSLSFIRLTQTPGCYSEIVHGHISTYFTIHTIRRLFTFLFNIIHVLRSKTNSQYLYQHLHSKNNKTICKHMTLLLHISALRGHLQRGG